MCLPVDFLMCVTRDSRSKQPLSCLAKASGGHPARALAARPLLLDRLGDSFLPRCLLLELPPSQVFQGNACLPGPPIPLQASAASFQGSEGEIFQNEHLHSFSPTSISKWHLPARKTKASFHPVVLMGTWGRGWQPLQELTAIPLIRSWREWVPGMVKTC